MKKRLFLGITIPEDFKTKLASVQNNQRLKTKDLPAGRQGQRLIRWVPKENYHITVSFLGYIDEKFIEKIVNAGIDVAKNTFSFSFTFEALNFAPPEKIPRMVWATFQNSPEFNALVQKTEKNLRKLYNYSDSRLNHRPIPHITLVRFASFKEVEAIKLPQLSLTKLQVESFSLFESKLSPGGPTYTELHRFSLKH